MNAFEIAINAVFPVFMMIALGYFARVFGVVGDSFVNQATRFVFRISLPILVFIKVAAIDINKSFDQSKIGLMLFCIVVLIIGYYLSKLIASLVIKEPINERGNAKGAFMQGSFRSNFLIIGYPILFNLYGDSIVLSVALLTLVAVPTANVLAIISLSDTHQTRGINKFTKIGLNIVTNPLIIAIGLGFLSIAAGFEFPQDYPFMMARFFETAASLATSLGLVAIGAFFRFDGLKKMLKPTIIAVIIKLIMMPFVVAVLAYLVGFDPVNIILLSVFLGGPSAISSFAMSNEMGGDSVLSGNIVILSSIFCVVTYIVMITILLNVLN
jgi:predicted permease